MEHHTPTPSSDRELRRGPGTSQEVRLLAAILNELRSMNAHLAKLRPQPQQVPLGLEDDQEEPEPHGITVGTDMPRLRPALAFKVSQFTMAYVRRDKAAIEDLRTAYDLLDDPETAVQHTGAIRYVFDLALRHHPKGDIDAAQAQRYRDAWAELSPYPLQSISSITSRMVKGGAQGGGRDDSRMKQAARVALAIIADADKRGLLGELAPDEDRGGRK